MIVASGHNERVQNADPTITQFKIPRVVLGEARTFDGELELLRSRGVEVVVLDDQRCVDMMRGFQSAHPELWSEDIAE